MNRLVQSWEEDRVESLHSYRLLDDDAARHLSALAELAAAQTGAPMAFIVVVEQDEIRCLASFGAAMQTLDRAGSLADRVITLARPVLLGDVGEAFVEQFPFGSRALAASPLIGRDGLPIGAVVVADVRARQITSNDEAALALIAECVMNLLELRRRDRAAGRPGGTDVSDPATLRRALDEGQLVPFFQPIADLRTGRPRAFEALLRWQHPCYGLIPPADFLPFIESSRLILPVGRYVLHETLALLAELQSASVGRGGLRMSVNVSPVQFEDPRLAQRVLAELARHGLPPDSLCVELTETAPLIDDDAAIRGLHALRDAGVQIAVDDYGAGYSALLRVLDLPISSIKLDRQITARTPGDRRAVAVIRSTLEMAADLGLVVVAEGVEHRTQQQHLLELGCTYGQGYLFGRPSPAHRVQELLRERGPHRQGRPGPVRREARKPSHDARR